MSPKLVPEGPPTRDWVVTAGLTRRVFSAPTLYDAQTEFITLARKGEIPGIRPNTQYQRGDLLIREATELDLNEFAPKRRGLPRWTASSGWASTSPS